MSDGTSTSLCSSILRPKALQPPKLLSRVPELYPTEGHPSFAWIGADDSLAPIFSKDISCSDSWYLQWPLRSRESTACWDTAFHRLHLHRAVKGDCGYTFPWAAFWAVLYVSFAGGFKTFWRLKVHTHKTVMSKWLKRRMDRKAQKWSTGSALLGTEKPVERCCQTHSTAKRTGHLVVQIHTHSGVITAWVYCSIRGISLYSKKCNKNNPNKLLS